MKPAAGKSLALMTKVAAILAQAQPSASYASRTKKPAMKLPVQLQSQYYSFGDPGRLFALQLTCLH